MDASISTAILKQSLHCRARREEGKNEVHTWNPALYK